MPALRQLIYVLFFAACILSFSSLDQWWHLKSGELMLARNEVLKSDPFSHTLNGTNWVAHSWGGAVAMTLIVKAGGFGLLQVIKGGLFLLFLILSIRLAKKRGAKEGLPLLLLQLAAVAFTCRVVVARPKVVTVLFILLQEWLVLLGKEKKSWFWAFPPLYLLWANMHGGFVVGLALLGLHFGGQLFDEGKKCWPILLSLLFSALAGLLNPRGLELYIYPFQYLEGKSFPQHIIEWQPMWPHSSIIQILAIIALFGLLVRRCYQSPKDRWEDLLVSSFSVLLSLRFQRNEYLLAATLVPAAAATIPQWSRFIWLKEKESKRHKAWVLLPVILISLWAIGKGPAGGWTSWNKILCPQAVAHLKANNYGPRLVHDFGVAGYLIHQLWPDYRVFIDGRNDFYHREGLFDEYLTLFKGKEKARPILQKRKCQTAVVAPQSTLRDLLVDLGWQTVFSSKRAVVLINPATN